MTKLTKILTILACTFALSLTIGCGKEGGGEGEGSVKDQYLAQVDKMCACMKDPATSKECMEPVKKAIKQIEKDNKDMPKEEQKEIEKAAKAKMADCMSAAMGGAGGGAASGAASGKAKGKALK
tara:strand:- start:300 stop:671 length:372 start_codon:yes stop_codon:yes gene_type:complete